MIHCYFGDVRHIADMGVHTVETPFSFVPTSLASYHTDTDKGAKRCHVVPDLCGGRWHVDGVSPPKPHNGSGMWACFVTHAEQVFGVSGISGFGVRGSHRCDAAARAPQAVRTFLAFHVARCFWGHGIDVDRPVRARVRGTGVYQSWAGPRSSHEHLQAGRRKIASKTSAPALGTCLPEPRCLKAR